MDRESTKPSTKFEPKMSTTYTKFGQKQTKETSNKNKQKLATNFTESGQKQTIN